MRKKRYIFLFGMSTVIVGICIGLVLNNEKTNEDEKKYMHASWVYNYGSLEELVYASDLIVIAKVEKMIASYYDESGIPFSEFALSTIQTLYSGQGDNKEFEIIMTGVEEYQVEDDPLLEVGDEYIIFAKYNVEDDNYTVLSGTQGRLIILDGNVSTLQNVNKQVRIANPYSDIDIQNEDIDQIIEELNTYINNKTKE